MIRRFAIAALALLALLLCGHTQLIRQGAKLLAGCSTTCSGEVIRLGGALDQAARASRPAIGVTMDLEQTAEGLAPVLDLPYVRSVLRAGGSPVLIPVQRDLRLLAGQTEGLDGLVITGSPFDQAPEAYGQIRLPQLGPVVEFKSEYEIALATRALETDVPLLGICNGMQAMTIASGGTLWQDLPSQRGVVHLDPSNKKLCHPANIVAGSLLHRLLGMETTVVNSSHHLAVQTPGSLRVTGTASDGTIEAVESAQNFFALGVQWHPERAPHQLSLFRGLVDAAARRAAHPSP